MTFTGEHPWAGALGHVLTAASFAFALLATIAFLIGARKDDASWTKLGKLGFRVHSIAVLGIIAVLFTMLFSHWFEYDYVWKHSNRQMPLRYILSCFWEGQEGSFLLWTFWHVVLGNVLLWRARSEWQAPVMTVVALVQVWLTSMLLGVYLFDVRIGINPFILIRELPENIGLPWTHLSNYLQAIPQFADGRGLNPLLQNYWMVIHPPTLFLGFACTTIPFAYAMAGLWKSRYKEWMEPALPWTFFGVMVLGTGVLMGGAWAYEALSFGGFWAWDPVENGSLVPWLVLVGAGHVLLVNKRKDAPSIFTAFLLVVLAFLLVLYATFITRSGVLGDTSVHSFTGEGYEAHLLAYMLSFVVLPVALLNTVKEQRRFYLLLCALILALGVFLKVYVAAIIVFMGVSTVMLAIAYRTRPFNLKDDEEKLWTREFWLFIGALVLVLSSAQISFSTSMPVFNILLEPVKSAFSWMADTTGSGFLHRLAGAKLAPPSNAIAHYNKWQIPFAFIVAILVGFGQYLRWKETDRYSFFRSLLLPISLAIASTIVICWLIEYRLPHYITVLNPTTQQNEEHLVWPDGPLILLLFATLFAAVANAGYFIRVLKGKLANAGPSVAHVGFAFVLLGALISNSRQRDISRNTQGPDLRTLNEGFDNNTEALLYLGDTVRMGDHFVTYNGRRADGVNLYYDMDYLGAAPAQYSAGDTVRVHSSLFAARDAHTATEHFLQDQSHWTELTEYAKRDFWHARDWRAMEPAAREFALAPLVQMNPKFGNVAEPSTRHWIHRDLYTHVRFANLDTADTTGYMPARLFEKHVGDTIVTPTSVIIMDSLRTVRDSVTIARLGPEFTVYQLRMRVRDLYKPDRVFEASPIAIYKGGVAVAGKAMEVPQLKQKYELASVQPGPDGAGVGLNVFDREFVVMQAIIFPGINILWTGCILMALGSFMAVRRRVRRGNT